MMNKFKELVQQWTDDNMSETVLDIIQLDAPIELQKQIYEFWVKHQDKIEGMES